MNSDIIKNISIVYTNADCLNNKKCDLKQLVFNLSNKPTIILLLSQK